MKKWIALLLAVCLAALCGCGGTPEAEGSFAAWEEKLCALVDPAPDEYLNSLTAEEVREALSLRAVYPGSYTASDVQELLCLISVSGVPHVGGTDRTILLLTDQAGSKALGQTTLAADGVEVALLEDSQGRSYPLFLGVGVQQGVHTYSLEMYEATAGGFVTLPALEALPRGEEIGYSYSAGGMLQASSMLPTEFPGAPPEYRSIGVWRWDGAARSFTPYQAK